MSTLTGLASGRYILVAQQCAVRFTAHGFGLPVRGLLSVRSGEVRVEDAGTTVSAVLDAASFRTANGRRDRDVRSARFLDVGVFPDVEVTGSWDGPGSPVRATLTVRGVAAPVEIRIDEVDPSARGATVRAVARVDRRLFPVGPGRAPIGRWVDVELEIALLPS